MVLDEAHAARRREQEEGEFNSATLLLSLLRQLQLRKKTRALLFLSATPMQTHPWEPWDLLAVLGEGGAWLADFATVRAFYQGIAAVESGRCTQDVARRAAIPIALDPAFPAPPGNGVDLRDTDKVARKLAFAPPSRRGDVARWLRRGSPRARSASPYASSKRMPPAKPKSRDRSSSHVAGSNTATPPPRSHWKPWNSMVIV